MDDAALLRAIQADDAEAFGAIFDRHAQAVHRYCARRADDRDHAEDLTSMVFLEAWRGRRRAVLVDASLRPWLLGIAHNVARNASRSARRHRAALARLHAAACEQPDHAETVAADVDAIAQRKAIAEAVGALTKKQRDVVELCLIDELSTAAAAAALGIAEGTVKSRLAGARARLRALLRPGELAALTDPESASGHEPDERHPGAPARKAAVSWTR